LTVHGNPVAKNLVISPLRSPETIATFLGSLL
jgi:hypothetical protein